MKAFITYDNKDIFEGYISILAGNFLRKKAFIDSATSTSLKEISTTPISFCLN